MPTVGASCWADVLQAAKTVAAAMLKTAGFIILFPFDILIQTTSVQILRQATRAAALFSRVIRVKSDSFY